MHSILRSFALFLASVFSLQLAVAAQAQDSGHAGP